MPAGYSSGSSGTSGKTGTITSKKPKPKSPFVDMSKVPPSYQERLAGGSKGTTQYSTVVPGSSAQNIGSAGARDPWLGMNTPVTHATAPAVSFSPQYPYGSGGANNQVVPAGASGSLPVDAASGSGGTGGSGLEPLTGWASRFKPDQVNSLISDPQAFMRQVLFSMGLDPDTNIGSLQAALPYAQNMNQLALIMLGANPDYEAGNQSDTLNWMRNYMAGMATPGGLAPSFGSGMDNLMGAASGGDSLNPLESYLQIADPAGQVDAFNSLAIPLAQASLNPLWARALQDELQRQGAAWVSRSASNEMADQSFNQFLASRGFSGY